MWSDLTTLYIKVVKGCPNRSNEGEAEVIGRGIVRIKTMDFPKMLLSLRAPTFGVLSPKHMINFGQFFVREIWNIYGK